MTQRLKYSGYLIMALFLYPNFSHISKLGYVIFSQVTILKTLKKGSNFSARAA